jgi:hypothetical protein
MSPGILLLAIAGVCHVLIAVANFPAAKVLNYRGELARVSPMVREIFYVQNLYIELILVAQAFICWLFPQQLLGGSAFGRFWSGFLTVFWGLRLAIQLGWYDRSARKTYWPVDLGMIAFQIYLTAVFVCAAFGVWRV